ncbi:MAG: hemolysin XhlA family protein [Anaerocolumna sp.]
MAESAFEREVLDRLTKIEVKLDSYDKIKDQVYENQRCIIKFIEKTDQQQQQIDELMERNKWLARAIAGACITAFVGLFAIFIKIGIGI